MALEWLADGNHSTEDHQSKSEMKNTNCSETMSTFPSNIFPLPCPPVLINAQNPRQDPRIDTRQVHGQKRKRNVL